MAFDYKKEYKEFYKPKNKPEIVKVPEMNYIAIRGQGDPNEEGGAYQKAIGVLYAIAYTIKMSYKGAHKIKVFMSMWCRPWRVSGGRMVWRAVPIIRINLPFIGFRLSVCRSL